ncbi:citrate synthase/methylcitrate synthase [Halorussus sp. MSC15.2]|uniref:citrate synthase/methylcitrate synthase n=1 Tax=Halorussus sp. MSC15.2 TaxID=2283638 RepID=UPI0013D84530|nr:citrate synthase/methylcitrate synthase [Halorussus sp. MSC15.2]NEU57060.1 citrate synthase/methylcitrate synthase [Halorussus sp. MSC15.2]
MADSSVHHGLEDVTVAETRLSRIDGENGELVIGGYPLEELAPNATFEETLYLLWNSRLPTRDELDAFETDLASARSIPDATVGLLRLAAERGVPAMDAVRMGIAAATLVQTDAEQRPERDARLAVAQLPTVAATYWRLRNGEEPVDPDESLGHAANFLYMLTGSEPSDDEVRGLETYLNSVVDHGLNASTFTARVVVSTESDVVSAVTGAVGALKGPLHGGAPGPVLEMLLDVYESGDPESYVRNKLESGERLMGFGHRVYEVRDPRAAVLSDAAGTFYDESGDAEFFEAAKETERVGVELLEEHKPELGLNTNVEFYTAVLLHGIGIPRELFTAVFAVSRVGGWTAHALEQLDDNRLIRPRATYVGETDRRWTSIEER